MNINNSKIMQIAYQQRNLNQRQVNENVEKNIDSLIREETEETPLGQRRESNNGEYHNTFNSFG